MPPTTTLQGVHHPNGNTVVRLPDRSWVVLDPQGNRLSTHRHFQDAAPVSAGS